MTKKELIEQAALEAYPENKGYSTVIEKVVDYNYIKRKPYQDGLEKGWQMAVDKSCEWLKAYRQDTPDGTGYIAGIVNDKTIEDFKKAMEE